MCMEETFIPQVYDMEVKAIESLFPMKNQSFSFLFFHFLFYGFFFVYDFSFHSIFLLFFSVFFAFMVFMFVGIIKLIITWEKRILHCIINGELKGDHLFRCDETFNEEEKPFEKTKVIVTCQLLISNSSISIFFPFDF